MTRAAFINIFKNHVNICGKNFAAYADAALVRWFISSSSQIEFTLWYLQAS